jgi:hypothetical protein
VSPIAVAVTQLAGWYQLLALAAAALAAALGDIDGTVASVLAMSSALSVEVLLVESTAALALLESLLDAAPPPQPSNIINGINPWAEFIRMSGSFSLERSPARFATEGPAAPMA